jgi:hypothetical protein
MWKDVFPVYLAGVLEEWRSVPGRKPPAPYEQEPCETEIDPDEYPLADVPMDVASWDAGEDPPTLLPLLSLTGEEQHKFGADDSAADGATDAE